MNMDTAALSLAQYQTRLPSFEGPLDVPPVSNTTPAEYEIMVKRAKEYIAAGDAFQIGVRGNGGRRQQHPDTGGVVDHERVHRLHLPALELRDEVGDRLVLGVQIEEHTDVAELERTVDEDEWRTWIGT